MFDQSQFSNAADANQRGELTTPQRSLVSRALFSLGCTGVLLAVIAVPLLVMVVMVFLDSAEDKWIPFLIVTPIDAILGGVALWLGIRWLILLVDFLSGRVEMAEGQIVWARSAYKAETLGRRLALISGLSLPPGTYRLYYLPRAALVVGADRLGSGSSARDELQRALAQTNRFPLEKLAEYRLGRMGDERYGRLTRVWIWSGLGLFTTLVVMGAMGWAFYSDPSAPWFMALFFGAFGLLILGLIGWSALRSTQDLLDGEVKAAEGYVQRTVRRSNRSTSYYYKLDGLSFSVSGAAYSALVEGQRYRVFYLPRSKTLLGIEPLDL